MAAELIVQGEQRRLSAIMFTDMVGYSSLTQKNERLALELLEEHRRLLKPMFEKHNGVIVKTIGDSFLVSFDNTLNAVLCALETQHTLSEYNAASPETVQIKIRIGIHLGDVVHRQGDVFGDGVNIASRVEATAEPGGIAVSEDVFRQVQNKIDANFTKLGKGELKNIRTDVAIYKVEPKTVEPLNVANALARLRFIVKQKRTRTMALAALACLILIAVVSQTMLGKSEKRQILVVVTDFVNETDVRQLEIQLGDRSRAVIEESPDLAVMTRPRMYEELKLLKKEKNRRVNEALALEICKQTHADVLITALVKKFGQVYSVDMKAVDPIRNQYLATAVEQTEKIDDLPTIVQKVSEKIRRQLESQSDKLRASN